MRDSLIPADELAHLFDALPDVVFFVKNRAGRYTHVNQTLVRRLGLHHRDEVIGRHAAELFPEPLGETYAAQDRQVLAGRTLENQLEVHLFPDHAPGWCLTRKFPLRRRDEITGVVGISRDLGRPDERQPIYARLTRVVDHLEAHYAESVRVETLAQLAGVSVSQLERHFRRVFQLNPGQMLTKLRIDAAMRMLHEPGSIAAIGQACGYSDQSAFTRQFRRLTGLTPGQYRGLRR
ncbi:MAG TPA: AraC family transcriptional regulator [Rhodanobacteraceae bacterium]|nr:AraC family transcriptional regulator [Rhodanobacteraceae bacterium]